MKRQSVVLKFVRLTAAIMVLVFALMLCTACKEKGLDVIFYDYNTGEKLSVINSIEDEASVQRITQTLVEGEECSQDIEEDVAYSLYLKDPKDSTYDIWYKVVVADDEVYSRMDFSKMSEEYAETFKEMNFTDEYYKCTDITVDELEIMLAK